MLQRGPSPKCVTQSLSLSLSLSLSVSFEGHFSSCIWVSQLQNVSILNFIGAKDGGDGGNKWSYKTCKALNRGH